MLHTHRFEVLPGGRDPTTKNPDTNRYCFAWADFRSPTLHGKSGIVWAPGHLYEKRRVCVVWRWAPQGGAEPGRMLNFHTNAEFGGWEPDNSSGVSPVAIDWFGDRVYADCPAGLVLTLQPNAKKHHLLMPNDEVVRMRAGGLSVDITLDITIGNPSGRVAVGVNGVDVLDVAAATCWPSQTGYWLWAGEYNSSGVPTLQVNEFVAPRVGRTREEALADRPTEASVWGSVLRSDPSKDAYRHVVLPDTDPASFRLPPSWGGTEPPPPPPPPPPSSHGPIQQLMVDAFKQRVDATLWRKYAEANPVESAAIERYWSTGEHPPAPKTATGRMFYLFGQAAWAAARAKV